MHRWVEKSDTLDILVISRCPAWPLDLGDRLIIYHLAEELSRRGHTLDLLAFYQRPDDPDDVDTYDRFFREVRLVREPKRTLGQYLVRHYRQSRRFPNRARECWSPAMWKAIAAQLRSQYHLVFLFGGVAVYEYFRLVRHLPTVIAPYESYTLYLERALQHAQGFVSKLGERLRLSIARGYESWMFTPFDAVVMVSDRDAKTQRRLAPSLKVSVIPNGVDGERFIRTIEDRAEPALVFTGNFSYPPNADAAFVLVRDIFPLVRAEVPRARLILAGANPPPALCALESDTVIVTGRVPDIRPYLDQATVYVCPLRMGAGIKNKVLEAMAMALPVVATPLSCDGISVTDEQDVLLAEGPGALAAAVVRVLKDPDLGNRLAQNASQVVRTQYTWRSVADRYAALFYELVRTRRRA